MLLPCAVHFFPLWKCLLRIIWEEEVQNCYVKYWNQRMWFVCLFYNVINSYLPFSIFSFFYDNVIAIRCIYIYIYPSMEGHTRPTILYFAPTEDRCFSSLFRNSLQGLIFKLIISYVQKILKGLFIKATTCYEVAARIARKSRRQSKPFWITLLEVFCKERNIICK